MLGCSRGIRKSNAPRARRTTAPSRKCCSSPRIGPPRKGVQEGPESMQSSRCIPTKKAGTE
eukprot:1085851-Alexandrium_andersonii.AAC.1